RRGGRRRSGSGPGDGADAGSAREAATEVADGEGPAEPQAAVEPARTGAAKRRRRRRKGSGATRPAPEETAEGEPEPLKAAPVRKRAPARRPARKAEAPEGSEGEAQAEPAPARKPRARRPRAEKPEEAGAGEAGAGEEAAEKPARATRGRRPAKPREAGKAGKAEKAEAAEDTGPTRTRRRRTRKEDESGPTRTRAARGVRRRREPTPVIRRSEDKVMLITERGDRDQIAVMEDRVLVEHYITRSGAHSMVGNIYLGRVQNVLPGMEAAFVDIGRGRNAVLYAGEVNYDAQDLEGGERRIERVLKPGQGVVVQVTKDPIGGKGARLTAQVSLPGRYLVVVPNAQVFGISRRLPDDERRRLRAAVKKVRPEQHGVIVRTAADGASEEDLAADVQRLVEEWAAIEKSAKKGKPPRVLYEEPELTVRVVRDLFTGGEFKEIVTDSERVFERIGGYLREVAPDLVEKVRLHGGPLTLFEELHATEQIHKALDRKVWLPSGGYIIIERVEAMTVIDVNTGKHVGKTNLEETVVKTNVEAAEEIARQLRLRDIGGIIIIDFIDMLLEKNRDKVVGALKEAMAQDKTRSQVFDITPLGLLEVTRKRVSAGLVESFSETCPTCGGRGILLTLEA
ncbi:MAG: Rne/Rng family ribonuclease, partial [Actinobacteria bacterium]|nr:Rne/Rng family ribonuclease [Actinomycetota bacterium]